MCLSVPAQLVEISGSDGEALSRVGKIQMGGIFKQVSLAYLPSAKVGDYVLVHVGFAISIIDESEAEFVFEYLKQSGGIDDDSEISR